MSTSDAFRWRKPESTNEAVDMFRLAVFLGPLIWCLRVYDDHCASMFRRPPDFHELARRARGEPPMAPLPKLRKRTLTNPLPPLESIQGISNSIRRSRQRTDSQTASGFLTALPYEIRQLIYEEVLAGVDGRLVHILRKNGGLGHWRCRFSNQMQDGLDLCDAKGQRCVEGWLSYKTKVWHRHSLGRIDLITDDGLVPVLQTCRIIYSEAIKTVYSKNVFHFYDPGDIRYFSRAILPQRLNIVHSIMIDWERAFSIFNPYNAIPKQDNEEWKAWRQTWAVIARMEGLQEVRVILKKHKFEVPRPRRIKMCGPMMGIKGLTTFELIIPFDDETDWDFATDAPFKIVKAPDRSPAKENPKHVTSST